MTELSLGSGSLVFTGTDVSFEPAIISLQNSIINGLITTLRQITTANGFKTDVIKVLRGVRGLDDFTSADMPGLAIFRATHNPDTQYYYGTIGTQYYRIWGYTKVEARSNNYDNLDNLVSDVEEVLMSSTYNLYQSDTVIDSTSFYEGGVQDSYGFFNMGVKVSYCHDLDTA